MDDEDAAREITAFLQAGSWPVTLVLANEDVVPLAHVIASDRRGILVRVSGQVTAQTFYPWAAILRIEH